MVVEPEICINYVIGRQTATEIYGMAHDIADKITKTETEWRAELPELAFKVTRKGATERAFTNDNFPKVDGVFHCICCGAQLFATETKFESGTGWPSFYAPQNVAAVEEREDNGWFMRRTEVVCARCDGHLGHVFSDGPEPTGMRYCINGSALTFKEADG